MQNCRKNFHPFLGEGIDIGHIGTIVPSLDVCENSTWKQNDIFDK